MADTNKENLVEKLTNIADGFRTSRSLTETLSLDEMAVLAAVPIGGGGDNKLAQLVDGTLTEITAEDLEGITQIRQYAFYYAPITTIEIPNTVTEVGEAGFKNSSITNLVFPNSITKIGDDVCENCKQLTNIVLPQNAQFTRTPDYAFSYCSNLDNVVIPENITTINTQTFISCSKLSNITLPNTLTTLGGSAFGYCSALTQLTIPASVTSIGNSSLQCGTSTNKATFTFLSTIPPTIQASTFNKNTLKKIIVPAGSGEMYKTFTNWTNFAEYIEEATE